MSDRPRIADLFCGAGGAAMGLHRAGFHVVGFDIKPQPRYAGDEFHQGDVMTMTPEELREFDAVWASPPCQGYSIMNNLPWLNGREYPLLIKPVLEALEQTGKPYILENVMGARHGAKGLKKRNLEQHGLKAGWLCGQMFGLPFYRHRLFATNWFWLAPGHPKHQAVIGGQKANQSRRSETCYFNPVNTAWRETNDGIRSYVRKSGPNAGKVEATHNGGVTEHVVPGSLALWQGNGAQANGVGVGHAKGWKLAAEAMGIDWMRRAELTQAIPPAFSEFLGRELIKVIQAQGPEVRND